MAKTRKLISVNDGHNASCVYLNGGQVIFALQEERVSRIKNHEGFPHGAINYLRDREHIDFREADQFIFTSFYVPISPNTKEDRIRAYDRSGLINYMKRLGKAVGLKSVRANILKRKRIQHALALGIPTEKIKFLDHHLCHAASAYYGWGRLKEEILVVTADAAGDDLCATLSIGHNGKLRRIASVHMNHSLGELWAMFTAMMGMLPMEHEYKLMGLAPYAPGSGVARVKKVLDEYFELTQDGLGWRVKPGKSPVPYSYQYFRSAMEFMRFDWIAGGLQIFTEEFVCRWVQSIVAKTGIRKLAFAGGLFLNVKVNQRINELPDVEEIFVFPSCGDDTLPFGAVYHMYQAMGGNNQPLGSLLLGTKYSDDEVRAVFDAFPFRSKYAIRKCPDVASEVAEVISRGEVVAWFQGREEFGARALGARSIVADPTKKNVINEINGMIKSRDFWMPFAASVLQAGAERYLVNPKKSPAPYMILTFQTTEAGADIEGGRHPFDRTCRPQVVYPEWNPRYHSLLAAFSDRTGRLGVLNTSLNLHGLPIASSPRDAFEVLDNSGLRFLAIENWLVEKKQ